MGNWNGNREMWQMRRHKWTAVGQLKVNLKLTETGEGFTYVTI